MVIYAYNYNTFRVGILETRINVSGKLSAGQDLPLKDLLTKLYNKH